MTGTRGFGRIVMMGLGLAVALLLLTAGEAKAGEYRVAQCGWSVGADASWTDTTHRAKFGGDAQCSPSTGQGALKSFTRRDEDIISARHFARWRWEAPVGTGISQVRGIWWHVLYPDGLERQMGAGTRSGGFDPFTRATSTDTTLREFAIDFPLPQPAFEDRLLCVWDEDDEECKLNSSTWSAVRALTITVRDDQVPEAGIGGDITDGGPQRGAQDVSFWGGDTGGGIRFSETMVDGILVDRTEYPCAKAMIDGEWRGTQMRPCSLAVSGSAMIPTADFSNGLHSVSHCVTDFAGNVGCTPNVSVRFDNDRAESSSRRRAGDGRNKARIFARLRWGKSSGSDLTVPFGAGPVLSGRLLDADGAGLADRELRVVARPSRGALVEPRVATVRTGKRGGFSLDLGAGPSRRITVNYAGDAGYEPASRPSMALRVRGGVTLSGAPGALRTGQSLRLRGRVRAAGAPIPRRGKLVAVQYLEAETGRWRPVLVTRTDHSGRFRAQYRFRYVVGTAKIRLRAIALPEERWPYAPGASRPLTIRVTG